MPQAEVVDEAHGKVSIEAKPDTERLTRTMIVERRYAVAMGVFWSMIGFIMIIVVLDGQDGERCEICSQNESIGVVVCRHGIGQDCAFELHRNWLMIATGVLTMGMIVMIYATFLYRAHGGAEAAAEIEAAAKLRMQEARHGQTHKVQDPDTAAIEMVREKSLEPTVQRVLLRIWRATPCHSIQQLCSHFSNRPLKALYRFERRKAYQARSIRFTARFTRWVEKQVIDQDILDARDAKEAARIKGIVEEHGLRHAGKYLKGANLPGKKGLAVPMLKKHSAGGLGGLLKPDSKKHQSKLQRAALLICFPVLAVLVLLSKAPCIPCLSRLLDRSPRLKKLCLACSNFVQGKKRDPFHETQEGFEEFGPSILEDVLDRYGFKVKKDEDEDAIKEKPETEEERIERLKAEKPDPLGHVETLRDAGGRDDIADDEDLEPTLDILAGSAHLDLLDHDSDAEHHAEDSEEEEEEVASHAASHADDGKEVDLGGAEDE